jgi:DNA-binding winged helix-turn-helix (wHTH) protein/TolB-like protein
MSTPSSPSRFDDFRFDPADGRLEHVPSGRALTLRPQAARLLLALLASPGSVVEKKALVEAVWDQGTVVDFEAGLAALMRELRQALDQLGGKAGLLQTIPRRGYRLQVAAAPVATAGTARRETGHGGRVPWRPWALLGLAVLVALGAGWWLRAPGPAPEPEPMASEATATDISRTMAVLPFQAYQQPDTAPRLELLLADAFLAELWRAELADIVLIGRATLLPYAGREDVAGAVARDLGVGLLIEGSVIRDADDGWRVTARLLEMPAGRVLWSGTEVTPGSEPLPVQAVAEGLARSLQEAWRDLPR